MEQVINFIKTRVSQKQKQKILQAIKQSKAIAFGTSLLWGRNLKQLALIYRTDKWGTHFYTPHYQHHFKKFRNKKIKLLEIGIGGYANPHAGGNSLRMWRTFFPKGKIYGIDIYDKSPHEEKRIKIFRGSQVDAMFLKEVTTQTGLLDIIIDDGSHLNEHVVPTFKLLFPCLKKGGIYVVEDTHTSYWPSHGGSRTANAATTMNFFKNLADGLNYQEYPEKYYTPTLYDTKITGIHFYHNMIFIYKGENNEGSAGVEKERMRSEFMDKQ